MNEPLVSILIPTYNRKKSLERLLESIYQSTYKHIETIIVDDASSDGTFEHVKKYFHNQNLQIIRNKKNLFAAGSRNVGIKMTSGKYILFIDDDNAIDKKMIMELVNVIEGDNTIGEVGPVNYSYLQKKKILWARTKRNMTTTMTNQSRRLEDFEKLGSWETDDIPNCYMVRSKILKKEGVFFDTRYGIMYEESDLAYSIKKLGYRIVVVRNAKIYHDAEKKSENGKTSDYLYHFMVDSRRPFVFARNRLIFHSRYSSKLQLFLIHFFWVWFFSVYYLYKIMFYKGYGDFSFYRRIYLSSKYLYGTYVGLLISLNLKSYENL